MESTNKRTSYEFPTMDAKESSHLLQIFAIQEIYAMLFF